MQHKTALDRSTAWCLNANCIWNHQKNQISWTHTVWLSWWRIGFHYSNAGSNHVRLLSRQTTFDRPCLCPVLLQLVSMTKCQIHRQYILAWENHGPAAFGRPTGGRMTTSIGTTVKTYIKAWYFHASHALPSPTPHLWPDCSRTRALLTSSSTNGWLGVPTPTRLSPVHSNCLTQYETVGYQQPIWIDIQWIIWYIHRMLFRTHSVPT